MKFRVVVSALAGVELRLLAQWLENQRADYGFILLDEFDESIRYLELYPLAQQLHKKSYRQLRIGRFQIFIIYELIDDSTVHIYKIVHGKQHPDKKRK